MKAIKEKQETMDNEVFFTFDVRDGDLTALVIEQGKATLHIQYDDTFREVFIEFIPVNGTSRDMKVIKFRV